MMQAALRVFSEKGYHAATIRDIVDAAGVAVGTFYFYFPDKETLFIYLYEETSEFLLQAIGQAVAGKATLERQIAAGIEAFVNIAVYEPAVVSLLQGEAESVPALAERRAVLRETQVSTWQRPLDVALDRGQIPPQNTRRTAEALTGAFDEVVLNLLEQPEAKAEATAAATDMTHFALRAVGLLPLATTSDDFS